MAGWHFNNTRIITQSIDSTNQQIIARLQPLASGTVLHFFGYEDEILKLSAYVVGDTDKNALKALDKTATSYALTDFDDNTIGNFYVKSVNFKREMVVCQTLREDLPEDSPVYITEFELYPDLG